MNANKTASKLELEASEILEKTIDFDDFSCFVHHFCLEKGYFDDFQPFHYVILVFHTF